MFKKNLFVLSLIVLINLLCTISQAQAYQKIEGAFGYKLGEVFDPYPSGDKSNPFAWNFSILAIGTLSDGTAIYKIFSEKPFRSFTKYFIQVTPKTNKIYTIRADGPVKNIAIGKKEQAVLMAILQKKYGSSTKKDFIDSLYNRETINQGNRYLLSKVSGIDIEISLHYYDKELQKLAEKERIELEVENIDDSGL